MPIFRTPQANSAEDVAEKIFNEIKEKKFRSDVVVTRVEVCCWFSDPESKDFYQDNFYQIKTLAENKFSQSGFPKHITINQLNQNHYNKKYERLKSEINLGLLIPIDLNGSVKIMDSEEFVKIAEAIMPH
jgi:hypothetical protein